MEALYPLKDYPNGPNVTYIYVFAVMQNILVAPVYFTLLELGQAKTSGGEGSVVKRVLQNFLRNPLIIMAISGLLYNLAFGAALPKVVDDIFILLGNAFACGALFSTGMGTVGQTEKLSGKGIVMPLFLSLTKSLFLPIITRYILIPVFGMWHAPFVTAYNQRDSHLMLVEVFFVKKIGSGKKTLKQFIKHFRSTTSGEI